METRPLAAADHLLNNTFASMHKTGANRKLLFEYMTTIVVVVVVGIK